MPTNLGMLSDLGYRVSDCPSSIAARPPEGLSREEAGSTKSAPKRHVLAAAHDMSAACCCELTCPHTQRPEDMPKSEEPEKQTAKVQLAPELKAGFDMAEYGT